MFLWCLLCLDSCESLLFFFNDTATTEIYTLSLHDALPISQARSKAFPNTALPSCRTRRGQRNQPATGQRFTRPRLSRQRITVSPASPPPSDPANTRPPDPADPGATASRPGSSCG